MYDNFNQIIFHSEYKMHNYYYSSCIDEIGVKLGKLLAKSAKIHVFPDATLKSNHFPNGIAIYSLLNETTLIPSLLRDPGCGFLTFKIHTYNPDNAEPLKSALLQFGTLLDSKRVEVLDHSSQIQSLIDSILYYGMHDKNQSCLDRFANTQFTVDQSCINITAEDYTALYGELNNVTNTIEIKQVIEFDIAYHLKDNHFKSGDVLGFIHTGTDILPQIIHRMFFRDIADYSFVNGMSSVDEIRSGLYGIPLANALGYTYYQWIKAAMNYCLYKRWHIFNEFAKFLRYTLHLEVELINDRLHAGAFPRETNLQSVFIQSRGVQDFFYSHLNKHSNYYLLAGQRESISFLLKPASRVEDCIAIGHGTSYAIDNSYDYQQLLGEVSARTYIDMCDRLSANTVIEKQSCLAYTFNILSQLTYLINQEYCASVHCLMPLANYQGKSLIRKLWQDK